MTEARAALPVPAVTAGVVDFGTLVFDAVSGAWGRYDDERRDSP